MSLMEPSEGFVQAGQLRLHYLQWGEAGPPAVLLHATGFLARLWQPIAEELSGRFRVVAFDARGHGDSDKPASDYNWAHFATDFRAFLDALDLRSVLAIGHSMGGATAAYLAATQPQYVSAAVLIEPIIFPPLPDDQSERRGRALVSGAARRRMVWPSPEALIRSYRKRPTFANWQDDVLRSYAEHGTFRREDGQSELKCPGKIEAQVFRNSLSLDTWSVAPNIRCPTLVLHGMERHLALAAAARAVAERIPGTSLATIEGAGHMVPMERPQAVVEQIMAFLSQEAVPK